MAREIVQLFHGDKASAEAERAFDKLFREKQLPEAIEEIRLARTLLSDGKIDIVSLLKETGLTESKSEARRLVEQGGVKVNEARVSDLEARISLEKPVVVQCGKRKFARVSAGSKS